MMTLVISNIEQFIEFLKTHSICPIKIITGIPCPGCGLTRAFFSLFSFDIHSSFSYHPLFWLIPIILIILLFRKRIPAFMKIYQDSRIWIAICTIFLIVYAIRMILYFPTTVPLDFNQNALLPSIISSLK